MYSADVISHNLVRGVHVARNLILTATSLNIKWDNALYVQGSLQEKSIQYKKENLKKAPLEAVQSLLSEMSLDESPYLIIYPDEEGFRVTLVLQGEVYSLRQPSPHTASEKLVFPDVEYIHQEPQRQALLAH